MGKLIPIFKNDDRDCLDNYHPICIFSLFSKVIEIRIYKHLTNYIPKFKLLSPSYFGLREHLPTELALITFSDKVKLAIDEGLLVGALFIDFTKAFDTIKNLVLLHVLESYGIPGPPL